MGQVGKTAAAFLSAALLLSAPGLGPYQALAEIVVGKNNPSTARTSVAYVNAPRFSLNLGAAFSAQSPWNLSLGLSQSGALAAQQRIPAGISVFAEMAVALSAQQPMAVEIQTQQAQTNEKQISGTNLIQATGFSAQTQVLSLAAQASPTKLQEQTKGEQRVFSGLKAALLRQRPWRQVFDAQRLASDYSPVFRDPWTAYWPIEDQPRPKHPELAKEEKPAGDKTEFSTQELDAIADRLIARKDLNPAQRATISSLIKYVAKRDPVDIQLLADIALLSLYDPQVKSMATKVLREFHSNRDAQRTLEKESLLSSFGVPFTKIDHFNDKERPEIAKRFKESILAYATPPATPPAPAAMMLLAGVKSGVFAQVDPNPQKAPAHPDPFWDSPLPLLLMAAVLVPLILSLLRARGPKKPLWPFIGIVGTGLLLMNLLHAISGWAVPIIALLGSILMVRLAARSLRNQAAQTRADLDEHPEDINAEMLSEIKPVILRAAWEALSLVHEGRRERSTRELHDGIQERLLGRSQDIVSRSLDKEMKQWAGQFLEELSQNITQLADAFPDPAAYRTRLVSLTNRIKQWSWSPERAFQFEEVEPGAAQPTLFLRELDRSLKPGQRLSQELATEISGRLGLNQEGLQKTIAGLTKDNHLVSFSNGTLIYTDLPLRLKEAGFSRMYLESTEAAWQAIQLFNLDSTGNTAHYTDNVVALHYLDQALRRYEDYASDSSGGEADYISELQVLRSNAALEVLAGVLRQEDRHLNMGEQTAPVVRDREAIQMILAWLHASYFELDNQDNLSHHVPKLDAANLQWLKDWELEFTPESYASYGASVNNKVVYGMRVLKRVLESLGF